MTKVDKTTTPIDLVEEVVGQLHKDRDLASLLVPKLLKGCLEFEKRMNELDDDDV